MSRGPVREAATPTGSRLARPILRERRPNRDAMRFLAAVEDQRPRGHRLPAQNFDSEVRRPDMRACGFACGKHVAAHPFAVDLPR